MRRRPPPISLADDLLEGRGSDYFANHPTVDKAALVTDINIDEDVMLWPLKDVVAIGTEHSTLEGVVGHTVERLNLVSSPDPAPEKVFFIRGDQYSFVRQGVPSLFLIAGFKSDDPNVNPANIMEEWETQIYHQPQDDMQQPG
jgi:Zn-dependent M28 family amino/carboxypeptidase